MNIKGKKIDFSKQELFIGIDVHKKSWTVTIRIPSTVLKTYSMRPSSKELNRIYAIENLKGVSKF